MWSAYCINIAYFWTWNGFPHTLYSGFWSFGQKWGRGAVGTKGWHCSRLNFERRAVSALGRKTALSVWSRGATLSETLEPFICVIDKDPVAVIGLGPLNMGKVVLNRRRLKVGDVGQPANVHPNCRRTITEKECSENHQSDPCYRWRKTYRIVSQSTLLKNGWSFISLIDSFPSLSSLSHIRRFIRSFAPKCGIQILALYKQFYLPWPESQPENRDYFANSSPCDRYQLAYRRKMGENQLDTRTWWRQDSTNRSWRRSHPGCWRRRPPGQCSPGCPLSSRPAVDDFAKI